MKTDTLLATLAIVTLASCASTSSPAQESTLGNYGPAEGESELTFGGSLGRSSTEVDSGDTFTNSDLNGQVGYGRYLSDQLEAGGQVIMSLTKSDGSSTSGVVGFLPYIRHNTRVGDRGQYYFGAHAGLVTFSSSGTSESSFSYGVHGGFKSWLTPQVSFFVEPRVTFSSFDFGDQTDFRTLLGFTYSL